MNYMNADFKVLLKELAKKVELRNLDAKEIAELPEGDHVILQAKRVEGLELIYRKTEDSLKYGVIWDDSEEFYLSFSIAKEEFEWCLNASGVE
ncbi:hypothetical protein [Kurthia sibirica]|uniref:Uncharacterized protein n=1 Tax=Kurthia sibirica TaxID=202750 RepID=A0A2U3AQZ7_9BACL|nr:hypothetical protein [Kurthia sibirica]PWI26980.1 hypothetical protein DEX24_01395 [Kurthia sibirica]GEK32468.1 hypothetical protein KSI01_00010 [Kurthia sibirica]